MQFEGFHVKYIHDASTGNTKGMFVSGIHVANVVHCTVGPQFAGKDFTCKPNEVVTIHVADGGTPHVAKPIAAPKITAAGKSIDDAVVAFVNARLEEGPLGLAFLQALYAFLNTGHSFRMSTIRSNLADSLKKAAKQGG